MEMRTNVGLGTITFLTLGAAAPLTLYAEVFMSPDQATHLMFPLVKLERHEFSLSPEQIEKIEKSLGESLPHKSLIAYVGPHQECMVVDQVIGKHETIHFAVGINSDGKVKQIEILEYRETYGGQIKKPEWRKQFVGKDASSPLILNQDIENISGATLSSAHVTAGVRRILHTYEQIKSRL